MSGVPSWAIRGVDIVCIDNSGCATYGVNLTVGQTYRLEAIFQHQNEWGCTVSGIGLPFPFVGFRLRRFGPTEQSDIATHFEALLRAPQLEDAL